MTGTWERCVREVTLAADPETVGALSGGWSNLSTSLGYLRDALVGRSFVGPIASGTERPHTDGLPGMLAGWKGSGGDAYREHLSDIGRGIEDLITSASNVSGALSRIEIDVRKAVASIPIPLGDDFGINEWSLPNGGELDGAQDGESASAFLAALRKDYQSDPTSYADGAFREKADGLEATMKVDGQASDHKRGGLWDTSSHLNKWYSDNQQAANTAAAPLTKALEVERPRLVVPGAEIGKPHDGLRPRTPPSGYSPSGLDGGSAVGSSGIGGGLGLGSTGVIGSAAYGGNDSSVAVPSAGGSFGSDLTGGGADLHLTPSPSAGGPGTDLDLDLGTSLAGAGGPTTVGGGFSGSAGLGLGGQGPTGAGRVLGLGSPSGAGGGGFGAGGGGSPVVVGGGITTGGIPGMVGGGNGRVPPTTSAARAVRNATGVGRDGGSRGSAGGLIGGTGATGRGSDAEHDESGPGSSWLTEDDDPWRADDTGSPGILR
ncbi:hypothetical protein [Micromonospora chokoriensis]|uniref:hypothetical protein n=1 Tax=Micromonospora chokoriensis TaxID=356851 RepID=UPI0004C3153D|nr:hypothetical protein [Micromonospora chokoriensis]